MDLISGRNSEESKEEPMISIIIPCKTIDTRAMKCITHCLEMEYANYEIYLLPDYLSNSEKLDKLVHVIPAGPIKPMLKRFKACSMSNGDFCAFIDSDAFPAKRWLRDAVHHFKNPDVAAVAGPTMTPKDDDTLAKVSGLILASPFGGGSASMRYNPSNSQIRFVQEAQTCNLIIRKSIANDSKDIIPDVWPGEEIVLCDMITKGLQKRIIYDPRVIVYHYRRKLFVPHLLQIWRYGAIRGYLLKKYKQYVRPIFFLPSLLVLGLVGGLPLTLLNSTVSNIYVLLLIAYFSLLLGNSIYAGLREKSIKVTLLVFIGVILTHLCYGLAFIKGLFQKNE
jgi:glycosyltransferase involved in cell wall biosynthesis